MNKTNSLFKAQEEDRSVNNLDLLSKAKSSQNEGHLLSTNK